MSVEIKIAPCEAGLKYGKTKNELFKSEVIQIKNFIQTKVELIIWQN